MSHLPTAFDPVAFIQAWADWQTQPQRSRLLHVVAHAQEAPRADNILALARGLPQTQHPLIQALAQACWGLLPGLHRLRFDHGQVCLNLHLGGPPAGLQADQPPSVLADQPSLNGGLHPSEAIVIGAGIAGASVARALALRGWQVTVLERGAQAACGASGLPVGLVAPHTSPDDSLISRLSRAGVRAMHHAMRSMLQEGVDWAPTGVQERRLPGKTRKGGAPRSWSDTYPQQGSDWTCRAPSPAPEHALWHAKGAWLKPAALVHALLRHPNIRVQYLADMTALRHSQAQWQVLHHNQVLAQANRVVVTAGPASKSVVENATRSELPINPLRGQLSWGLMQDSPQTAWPQTPVNGHGSFIGHIPTDEGPAWFAGSTFDRHHDQAQVFAHDHAENFTRLHALLPDTADGLAKVFASDVRGWAGVRCSVPDRLPVVGPIANAPEGLWVSTAMGSRGLTLAVLCAEVLAARWHNEPLPIEASLARALDAMRYQRQAASAQR